MACVYYTFSVTVKKQESEEIGMNRHIYRLVAAVLAAITIVSCNGTRKSETYRLLRITDFEDGEFTVRVRCHLKEADEDVYKQEYLNYYYRRLN